MFILTCDMCDMKAHMLYCQPVKCRLHIDGPLGSETTSPCHNYDKK